MKTLGILALSAFAIVGCGPTRTPSQLTDARVAFMHAERSPGASLALGDMQNARQSLDAAEKSFAEDGASRETTNLAYIAHRKAIAAHARADAARALEKKRTAIAGYERSRDAEMSADRMNLDRGKGGLSVAQQEIDARRQARTNSETKLGLIQDLKSAQSERGLTLTLNGGTFAAGQSALTPAGKKHLAEIASALKEDRRVISVIGFTGASDAKLGEHRARAVRNYLVDQGLPDGRIRAEGIAKPASATDSRVEIVLENEAGRR